MTVTTVALQEHVKLHSTGPTQERPYSHVHSAAVMQIPSMLYKCRNWTQQRHSSNTGSNSVITSVSTVTARLK
jgi:hypothetical protein